MVVFPSGCWWLVCWLSVVGGAVVVVAVVVAAIVAAIVAVVVAAIVAVVVIVAAIVAAIVPERPIIRQKRKRKRITALTTT